MLRIFTWKALLQFLLPEIISNCPLFVRIRSKVHIQTWLKLTFDKKGERENTSYSLPWKVREGKIHTSRRVQYIDDGV